MIGRDALDAAFADVQSSGGTTNNVTKQSRNAMASAGVDYDDAHEWATHATRVALESGAPVEVLLRMMFLEALLMGVRAGRADAVELAQEMSLSNPEGES